MSIEVGHQMSGPVSKPFYWMVGQGKLAKHLSHFFTRSQISFQSVNSRHLNPDPHIQAPHAVLLAVSDSAIESVATHLKAQFPHLETFVHFSGSLLTPLAWSFHPLMTFGSQLYPLETYQSIGFTLEEKAPDFLKIFPQLSNRAFRIKNHDRARYHSLCVLSGNFSVLLWQKFFNELENRFQIPRDLALPYLKQIASNLAQNPEAALTGPLARGDQATIDQNISALEFDAYQNVYRAFVHAYHSNDLGDSP